MSEDEFGAATEWRRVQDTLGKWAEFRRGHDRQAIHFTYAKDGDEFTVSGMLVTTSDLRIYLVGSALFDHDDELAPICWAVRP